MITYTINIGCDGGCGETFQSSPMVYPDLTPASAQAKSNGWTRNKMTFLCPACTERKRNTPSEGAERAEVAPPDGSAGQSQAPAISQ